MKFLDYLFERFGIPHHVFDEYGFYSASRGRIYIGPKSCPPKLNPVSMGLLAARSGETFKPSTNLLQLFGGYATKNIVNLGKENALKYAKGEDVEPTSNEQGNASQGYVIVSYIGSAMGCGFLKDSKIKNMIPKAKRIELKFL